MKTIEQEEVITKKVTKYQAADGTVFNDAEECSKYENSAAGVLLAKVAGFSNPEPVVCEILDDCENEYRLLTPKTAEDIDIMNQLFKMFGGKTSATLPFDKNTIGTPVIIGYRFCRDDIDWLWFNKVHDIVKELTADTYELKPKKK